MKNLELIFFKIDSVSKNPGAASRKKSLIALANKANGREFTDEELKVQIGSYKALDSFLHYYGLNDYKFMEYMRIINDRAHLQIMKLLNERNKTMTAMESIVRAEARIISSARKTIPDKQNHIDMHERLIKENPEKPSVEIELKLNEMDINPPSGKTWTVSKVDSIKREFGSNVPRISRIDKIEIILAYFKDNNHLNDSSLCRILNRDKISPLRSRRWSIDMVRHIRRSYLSEIESLPRKTAPKASQEELLLTKIIQESTNNELRFKAIKKINTLKTEYSEEVISKINNGEFGDIVSDLYLDVILN